MQRHYKDIALKNRFFTSALSLALVAGMGLTLCGSARAQESGTVPPVPGTAGPGTAPSGPGQSGAGAPAGAPQGGPPPLPVLLGGADILLTIDRPFEAEKLYKLILQLDPNNPIAKQGLRDAKEAQRPQLTLLAHTYYDSKDVQLLGYGGGPIFRFPYGKLTITAGDGYYKNNNSKENDRNPLSLTPAIPTAEDNFAFRKQTYNVLFEPFWNGGKQEGSVFLSQQNYKNAPDRFLYDVRYSYVPIPGRGRFTIGTGKKDSFYQNQINQFLAPETFYVIKEKITFRDYYAGIEYPLGKKYDFTFNYRHFRYSDTNERDNFRYQLLYRLQPTDPRRPFPVWRVGIDGVVDEGKFFVLKYGIPQDFQSVSIATDYVSLQRSMKYALYFSYPIWRKNFAPPAGFVGYIGKNISRKQEIFAKVIVLDARNLSVSLYDYVVGINTRF